MTRDPVTSAAEPSPGVESEGPSAEAAPAARVPMLLQAVGPAVVGGLLALAALPGPGVLLVGVALVQALLVLGVLALVEAPSSEGLFVVAGVTVGVGDVLVLRAGGDAGSLAGVVALGVVAALAHQLFRPRRHRVTESLADALLVMVVASSAACLIALRDLDGGGATVGIAIAAAAACLFFGRLGDLVLARPVLAVGSTRGWPGLLLGLGTGVAAASLAASQGDAVEGARAALLGLAVAATAATADLAVDLGAAELRATRRDARRVSALGPVALLLPYAALGPVALLAGRLVLP